MCSRSTELGFISTEYGPRFFCWGGQLSATRGSNDNCLGKFNGECGKLVRCHFMGRVPTEAAALMRPRSRNCKREQKVFWAPRPNRAFWPHDPWGKSLAAQPVHTPIWRRNGTRLWRQSPVLCRCGSCRCFLSWCQLAAANAWRVKGSEPLSWA